MHVDRLNQAHRFEDRQHAEHHQHARGNRAQRHREQRPDIEPGDLQQHGGGRHRGQHEDQAVAPEVELDPEQAQRRPLPRMEVGRPIGGDSQRRDHDGDHAGDVQVVVGQHVARIGEAHRHRRHGRIGIAEARQDQHGHTSRDETERDAAQEFAHEDERRALELGRHLARCHRIELADQQAHEEAEGGDGDRVVEQRFALGEDRQALGRADVAEDADHRRRIGGRHDRAEQQADDDVDAGRHMDRARDADDANHHRHDRHQQHGEDLVEQAAHVDGEAGGEEQRRQEERQEDVGAQLQALQAGEDVSHQALDMLAARHPDAEEAQRQAGDGEQLGMRQAQPFGERNQHADDGQHQGNRQQRVQYFSHRRTLTQLMMVVISY